MDGPVSGLTRAIGVRPGEGRRLASVAALFALVETGRAFGEIGVETLVLGRYGPTGLPSVLPFLYMGLGATGLIVALAYTAALGRVTRARLFVGLLGLGAALIIGWRIALGAGVEDVLLPLWLTIYVIGSIVRDGLLDGRRGDVRRPPGEAPLPAADRGGDRGRIRRVAPGRSGRGAHRRREPGPDRGGGDAARLPLLVRLVRRPTAGREAPAPVTPRRGRSALADLRAGFDVVAALAACSG